MECYHGGEVKQGSNIISKASILYSGFSILLPIIYHLHFCSDKKKELDLFIGYLKAQTVKVVFSTLILTYVYLPTYAGTVTAS